MSDLREKVARALHTVERGGCWDDEGEYHKQDFYNMADPVIALVLEEAAKVADKRATELSILRDGAPHVSANGHLSWSDYNSCCVEIRSLAIELCKLALEVKHD